MLRVGLLLFEEFDLLDAGGPYEVLLTANRLATRKGEEPPFEVLTVGLSERPVTAYGGLVVTPQQTLANALPLDVCLVVGTIAVDRILANRDVMQGVRHAASSSAVVGSVCTGAFLLGEAQLLDGRAWTTHWEDIDALADRIGNDGARRGVRVVDEGQIVTAGGLSCGIDLGLHLVERFVGPAMARATARQIDYPWTGHGEQEGGRSVTRR